MCVFVGTQAPDSTRAGGICWTAFRRGVAVIYNVISCNEALCYVKVGGNPRTICLNEERKCANIRHVVLSIQNQ